jgi:aspartyl-tRNA(Asn)/glutamyl-tRNA(Gln) amidotransferase subunit B
MDYEAVIGLEVHVQLKTNTKMFTRAPYRYGEAPNTLVDPLVLGLPGVLPVFNLEAIKKTIQLGLMFDCQIAEVCKWDRKHYFYPDLPKGYQISQYDQPLCVGGRVEIELPGPARNIMGQHRTVRLNRIHLEEDVGKLSHLGNVSLVDYNRAGACLVEIVSEPDIFSPEEAFAYLTSLKTHLIYAGLSDCDMEKGQLRCDANISIRPKGSTKLGTKVELKNLNSISGVRNGIAFEIKRQTEALNKGQTLHQETRRWDLEKEVSSPLRGKENAHDYRYFPDPDLMPIQVSEELKLSLKAALPELPFAKQERFFKDYGLAYTHTSVLCSDKDLSAYFEKAVQLYNNPITLANLVVNDLLRELGSSPLEQCRISPKNLAELVRCIDEGKVSKQMGQDIFKDMFLSGKTALSIIQEKGLSQNSDQDSIKALCQEAIAHNPKAIQEYRQGKTNAINALKGAIMKASQGKANPKLVDQLLTELIQSESS